MSEEDPSTNRRDSDEEDKGVEEIEDGYQTPKSEEHKIPPVTGTPPPPPNKLKRLFMERRVYIRKVEGFNDGRIVVEEDLESFFKWIVPRQPPHSRPEHDVATSPKKIRSD